MKVKKDMIQDGHNDNSLKDVRKRITRSVRADKRTHTASLVSKDIDERDPFMGLRWLRKLFVSITLGMKDDNGKHVPFEKRAQAAADFLGSWIWGGDDQQRTE